MAVGRIVGAWGVRGWLRVQPFNAAPESVLLQARTWWLAGRRALRVTRARVQGEDVIAEPLEPLQREAVLALKGTEVLVSRATFPESAPGEYYWVDLIGCEVSNPAGYRFGTVLSVDDHGAHPLLDVGSESKDASTERRLIPFVGHFIVEVDLAGRRIVVDWEADY